MKPFNLCILEAKAGRYESHLLSLSEGKINQDSQRRGFLRGVQQSVSEQAHSQDQSGTTNFQASKFSFIKPVLLIQ